MYYLYNTKTDLLLQKSKKHWDKIVKLNCFAVKPLRGLVAISPCGKLAYGEPTLKSSSPRLRGGQFVQCSRSVRRNLQCRQHAHMKHNCVYANKATRKCASHAKRIYHIDTQFIEEIQAHCIRMTGPYDVCSCPYNVCSCPYDVCWCPYDVCSCMLVSLIVTS